MRCGRGQVTTAMELGFNLVTRDVAGFAGTGTELVDSWGQ